MEELTDFRGQALAHLAAQHEEILQLRAATDPKVSTLILVIASSSVV